MRLLELPELSNTRAIWAAIETPSFGPLLNGKEDDARVEQLIGSMKIHRR